VDGDFEAHLVAVRCSEPPEGFARWSLRLLADKVVERDYIDSISHETVRHILKNEIKPWQRKGGVIPPEQNSNFVANMEMVLDVYKRPFDPLYPVVCMDESPKHGSGLNMAEIELNVLSGQCLNRRIDDIAVVRKEVLAWQNFRDNKSAKVNWQFTAEDARIKLSRLYPTLES
jgi:hypothetical protein